MWQQALQHGRDGTMHFLGLHSDGDVHSNNEHLYAMLRNAAANGVTSAAVHILHDGRDVPARSALTYIAADRGGARRDQRRRARAGTSASPRAAVA